MGDKIGFGPTPFLMTSAAYFLVDWKVASAVAAWMWSAIILANREWSANRDVEYFGMSQFWFMGAINISSWIA